MLLNVPRSITSWFTRREAKELNCSGATPRAMRYRPATPSGGMAPTGEIWSVVMESPSKASGRRPARSATGAGLRERPSKKGGRRM